MEPEKVAYAAITVPASASMMGNVRGATGKRLTYRQPREAELVLRRHGSWDGGAARGVSRHVNTCALPRLHTTDPRPLILALVGHRCPT